MTDPSPARNYRDPESAIAPTGRLRRALFLDRDGVINVNHGYVHTAEQTQWLPGIFELCRAAHAAGFVVVVVTNQAGIARGLYTEAQFLEYTRWVHEQFRQNQAALEATFYCPHHPDVGAGVGDGLVDCDCRKPKPGMLLAAAQLLGLDLSKSLLLGDAESDLRAAAAAGVGRSFLLGRDLQSPAELPALAGWGGPSMEQGKPRCPVCREGFSVHYTDIDGVPYLRCESCRSIHVEQAVIDDMDAGRSHLRDYGPAYWEMELKAARVRAKGVSPCRAGEAILYCRRPVQLFLDIGAGPGFLLQELLALLDPAGEIFHAVEKFAPAEHFRHRNYHHGSLADLQDSFDAGVCIEVVEHLTPAMLGQLASALARVSKPDSYWLFNTGMDDYVEHEDPAYLDPYRRGHIVSYSVAGIRSLFEPFGFRVHALPGKSFAFAAEFQPTGDCSYEQRIYRPLDENAALLQRHPLLYNAAFESARSYYYAAEYLQRTQWALSLAAQLAALRQAELQPPEPLSD